MRFNTRIFISLLLVLLASCEQSAPHQKSGTFESMGTTITVLPYAAMPFVKDIFLLTDRQMSEWKKDSPLALINQHAGNKPVQVPQDLFRVLQRSLEIAEMTSGAFDPTWASLWEHWKFDDTHAVPSQEQINVLLPSVNWENILLNKEEQSVYLPLGNIGLGGIAKGVALDKAREVLLGQGFEDFMIVAGGQVLVHGFNDGKLWRVGLRDPERSQTDYFGILEISDTCISTSGNYENFFIKDGVRYHHIINPRTGFPAEGVQSVTVISSDATLADALSTALFVMGPEKGMQCINRIQHAEALMIDTNDTLFFSRNFEKFLSNSYGIQRSASSNLITTSDY
jgi:thiamine biosynthesis lipoprotein